MRALLRPPSRSSRRERSRRCRGLAENFDGADTRAQRVLQTLDADIEGRVAAGDGDRETALVVEIDCFAIRAQALDVPRKVKRLLHAVTVGGEIRGVPRARERP